MTSDTLMLAELLCARLCHDLAGPVGAAAAGAELLGELGGEADAETVGLVAASAAGAAARLKFFRAALGPAPSVPQPCGRLRDLAGSYLQTVAAAGAGELGLAWTAGPEEVEGGMARLLLNLVLLARDSLPRGGSVEVRLEEGGTAVTASGEGAGLSDEAHAVLVLGLQPEGPRGAQALFARHLAEARGAALAVRPLPGAVRLECRTGAVS